MGCDSIITVDLTIPKNKDSVVDITACELYTSPSGNNTWTTSGIYFDTIPSSFGCDSVITMHLSIIDPVDNDIIVKGDSLLSSADNVSYQWINCDTDQIINGETNKLFIPTETGTYKVAVDRVSCTYTSSCYSFFSPTGNNHCVSRIFPNPSGGPLTILLNDNQNIEIAVYDAIGRLVYMNNWNETSSVELNLDVASGVYFAFVLCSGENQVFRVVLE